MGLCPQRAPTRVLDWEVIPRFADENVIQTLESNPEFMSATNRPDQYYLAYALLYLQRRPAVSVSMIGNRFNISKGTIRSHSTTCVAQATTQRGNGRPSILSQEEHYDLVNHIIDAYTSTRAWTMRDIFNHTTE
jgi:hypothetical protein